MPKDQPEPETHPSWALARFGRPRSTPGAALFDSDIRHQSYVTLTISRADRRRDGQRDWLYSTEELIEVAMSHAQFGALVSSFGDGGGVPVTITDLGGQRVEQAPFDSRLAVTAAEVGSAASEAVADLQAKLDALEAAVDARGIRGIRDAMTGVRIAGRNLPANMQHAAKRITEHTEDVVTKARADIEAMVDDRAAQLGFTRAELGFDQSTPMLPGGDD